MAKKTMKKRNSVKRGNKSMKRRMRRTRRKVSRRKYHRKRTKRLKMRGGAAAGATAATSAGFFIPPRQNQVITGITQVFVRTDTFLDQEKCPNACNTLYWFCTPGDLVDHIVSNYPGKLMEIWGNRNVVASDPVTAEYCSGAIDGPGWVWVNSAQSIGGAARVNVFLKKYIEAMVGNSWNWKKWDYYVELTVSAEKGAATDKGERWKFRYGTKQPAADAAVLMAT